MVNRVAPGEEQALAASGLDPIDVMVIASLRRDPRTTNKTIARDAGVSESTIANRIRGLTERRVMKVTLQRDFHLLGWTLLGMLFIEIEGRSSDDVGRNLCDVPELLSVTVLPGTPQLACTVGARDSDHLYRIVYQQIAPIAGVGTVETSIWTDLLRYDGEYSQL